MNVSYKWDKDFPKGYGHTSIAYLKRCVGFEQAKAGDYNAAKQVVRQCIKRNRVDLIHRLYPSAVLLPVITKNRLPLALATAIGLPVYNAVKQINSGKKCKNMCAMERLIYKSKFHGYVPPGIEFIIVDDIVTQGSTISELRKHVLSQGSFVIAIVALAYSIGSTSIAPKDECISRIKDKFEDKLIFLLAMMNIANDFLEMTNSQLRYLLRFKSLDNILIKMKIFF